MGWSSPHIHLGDDATQADVEAAIREMNEADDVDAFLVQHPAPPHIDYDAALMTVDPDKDVDGMHPLNMGRLALGVDGPIPCTPAGIEALLAFYEVPVVGRNLVILGRGITLGRPLALLMSAKRPTANAAVTVFIIVENYDTADTGGAYTLEGSAATSPAGETCNAPIAGARGTAVTRTIQSYANAYADVGPGRVGRRRQPYPPHTDHPRHHPGTVVGRSCPCVGGAG